MMRTIVLMLMATVLASCTTRAQQIMEDASQSSAIAVASGDFDPRPGQTFTWYSDVIWSSGNLPEDPATSARLRQLVEEELAALGYRVLGAGAAADYVIGLAVVDDRGERSEEIEAFFSLFPELGQSQSGVEDAAIYAAILSPQQAARIRRSQQGDMLWRASLRGYVIGDGLSAEQRDERLRGFVSRLLRSLR